MSLKEFNPVLNIGIDRMLRNNPAKWLAYQMTLTQEPLPKTVDEAMLLVEKKASEAIESATKQLQADNDKLVLSRHATMKMIQKQLTKIAQLKKMVWKLGCGDCDVVDDSHNCVNTACKIYRILKGCE